MHCFHVAARRDFRPRETGWIDRAPGGWSPFRRTGRVPRFQAWAVICGTRTGRLFMVGVVVEGLGEGEGVPAEGARPPLGGGWAAPTASHSLVVCDLIPRWAGSGCPGLSGRWVGPGLPPLRAGTAARRKLPAAPVGRSRSCHGRSRTRCSRCPPRLWLSSTSHYLMWSSSTLMNTARLTAALPAIGRRMPLRGTTAVSLVLRHDVCGPVPRRAASGA